MTNYQIESNSCIGGRSENQDYFQLMDTKYGLLAIVCDGMGGKNGGKYAAELAVAKILEAILTDQGSNPKEVILASITNANALIFGESQQNEALRGMGTTVTVLLINESSAMCFHVGDSRIYQIRKGHIQYRTFDHSKVFEMVNRGILTEEEARVSSESNIINRALGISPDVEISVSEELPYKKEDRFLLCTDGIWGAVPETQLVEMVSLKKPIKEVVQQLAEEIDQIGIDNGGTHDNLTAALIETQNDSILSAREKDRPILKKWQTMIIVFIVLILIIVLIYLILKK
jgi:serine/threonine protein phosphatase PrpC